MIWYAKQWQLDDLEWKYYGDNIQDEAIVCGWILTLALHSDWVETKIEEKIERKQKRKMALWRRFLSKYLACYEFSVVVGVS